MSGRATSNSNYYYQEARGSSSGNRQGQGTSGGNRQGQGSSSGNRHGQGSPNYNSNRQGPQGSSNHSTNRPRQESSSSGRPSLGYSMDRYLDTRERHETWDWETKAKHRNDKNTRL
ncbi:uncharacterized protein TRIVIDRAFT_216439 [Trichoderma virens Gv29-8]|uniref:Uncharacterized protein n=1 Tax=Hypocrea virens (strain Gv29-8 / FGSC 10586) TaxID=413071 RepID=G9MZS4_HYPVG|nr:uncharacterized protein TRIVIDRAFT_216439 [Trichoderma virens Gv29-8]EHK20130.1 hypothetical protein TRIVIDRAFT_216439 [Trichoderma virens Gv29-8]UKZ72528.1 hypothetical protein TrVFT333_000158 [Trichoderma virens FT-333]